MRRDLPIFFLGVFGTLALVFGIIVLTRDGGTGAATSTPVTNTAVGGSTSAPGSSDALTTVVSSTIVSTTAASTTVPGSTTVPATRCAGRTAMALPPGVELSGGNGNFDGPPEPDSIMDSDGGFVFSSEGTWYVGFSLNDGYVVVEPLPEPLDAEFVPEAVVWDFDGDDGLLIKIDRSSAAGAEVYAFYFLDEECGVEDAGTADTERYEFLDWFGADHSQAFTCAADGVFETLAARTTGNMWEVRDMFFEWTAPAWPGFIFGFEDGMEVPEGDPAIAAAGMVDC